MRKKLSKFLVLVIVNAFLINLLIQPNKVYAYVTAPKISAGFKYAFALKSDGTVYGWGYNNGSSSYLGIGANSNPVPSPTQVTSNVKDIFEALETTFAVLEDGSVKMWGSNGSSQMGIGGNSTSGPTDKAGYSSPTLHPLVSNVKKIVTSNCSNHVFAILNDNTIKCWGSNSNGQLGTGNITTAYVPITSSFTDVKDIAVGSRHTLVLKNSGYIYSTGDNGSGQLGIGSTAGKLTLTRIDSLVGVDKIFTGYNNCFAVKTDGKVYGWGINSSGCLGVGDKVQKTSPMLVPGLTNVSQISATQSIAIALMSDGTVKTAGSNLYGELGNPASGSSSSSFNTVPGITNAVQVQAGIGYSMVLLADGTIVMFGKNSDGQLGLGYTDTNAHQIPTAIPGLSLTPDTTPPVITIGSYNINPTKQNITVTASTNEGTLNATSHVFTENGSFEFVATDSANNVTRKTVTITNIDKTTPIISVGSYDTNPTNKDITVNVSVNEGTLNYTSHTFISNGSYDFIATDAAGNVTTKTVTITNIDKVAPIITIDPYDTDPTNQDIVVTASTNEGLLNATSHTFASNGSFNFVVIDDAGNVTTKTVTINNIDKTVPIISVGSYNTTPTNKDITVTASVDKGTLNVTSHTFIENGSFEFVVTDSLGNVTTKTVTITNIDKDAPSKPVISVVDNKLTIVSGTDGEFGVQETLYQLNNGNWKVYSDVVTLADGIYEINAKTVDNAGNESSFDTCNANVYKNAFNDATDALDKAENTKTQVDLDTAIALINALPDSPEKTDLINRANNLQTVIDGNDAVSEATRALVKAENTYIQADLDTAIALINALPDSPEKTDLLNRANNLQKLIDDNNPIKITADADEVVRIQMVNLTLKASDLVDLYTMQFEIRYDPERLELDQPNMKNFTWENDQNGYAAIKVDSSVGVVNIIYSRKGNTEGVSGNIDLIGLPFKTLRIGKTTVEVSNFKLINSQGKKIKASTTSIIKEINILPNPLNVILTGEKGQNDWYISPVTVEINDLDAKEIYYSIDGVKYSYTQPFSINEIGEHNLIVTINDGNGYSKEKEQVIKIDYNSPTISVDNQTFNWQNEVKVMPNYDDQDGSGILQGWYQWTNTAEQPAQWEEYNQGELIQATEGNWYLHTKATDVAGNVGQTVFGPYKIDKTVPVISVDNDKREAWGITEVSVTPTFVDEGGSQLEYVGYQWSLGQSIPSEYTPYTSGSLQQSNDGAWYLHLIAEDEAGNVKTVTYGPYNIDKGAPIIEFSEVSEGMDYTDSITPIISISDTASGIKVTILQLDGQDYVSGTPITERGAHSITAFAEDNTGNTTTKSISFFIYTSTTLTLDIPQVEYSDIYTIRATLTTGSQAVSGAAITVSGSAITVSGAAISIRLNGTDMGTYYTDSQGNVILNGITSFKAGSYTVEAIYLPDGSEYFGSSQSQSSLIVLTEKNSLNYTESYEVQYPVIFTVQTLVSQEDDGNPGDLSLSRFSVEIIKLNTDGSTTFMENFITSCDANGMVSFERNYDIGTYTVDIKLLDEGYYTPGIANITVHVY
jgi:hypothetical protein